MKLENNSPAATQAPQQAPSLTLLPPIAGSDLVGLQTGGGHRQGWASPEVPLTDPFQTIAPPKLTPQESGD